MAQHRPGGDGATARAYHERTKHSVQSLRGSTWVMERDNKPHPFKVYEGLERVVLPRDIPGLGVGAIDALRGRGPRAQAIDARGVARLLAAGAGVHHSRDFGGGDVIYFRNYASAGALYPVEVYAACGDLPGLASGVYHFDPVDAALTCLRQGDHRAFLGRAVAGEPSVARAPLVLVLTGIPWRTAWKYTERGYRHLYWDAGMVLANVLALAASAGYPARVVLGFDDEEVEALLGLDGRGEFPLCLLALGSGPGVVVAEELPSPVSFAVHPLSPRELRFPGILEANDAGRLRGGDEVLAWRAPLPAGPLGVGSEAPSFEAPPPSEPSDLEAAIRRRGSARAFGRGAVPARVLLEVLGIATAGAPTDYAPGGSRLVEPYLVANAVEGLASGSYVFQAGEFRPLRAGDFRNVAGHLCLGQRLGADAAATHFLMVELNRVLGVYGDRGYRAAQLEAGILAGRLYLGAYAFGYGATGLTFFDEDVTRFFSPASEDRSCMLVVALGQSVRRLLPLHETGT